MTAPGTVRAQAPAAGVTHRQLVEFGGALTAAGVSQDNVSNASNILHEVATEAAFKGAAAIAELLRNSQTNEVLARAHYVDQALRSLRTVVLNQQMFMGRVDRNNILAAIASMLTTPEPTHNSRTITVDGRPAA